MQTSPLGYLNKQSGLGLVNNRYDTLSRTNSNRRWIKLDVDKTGCTQDTIQWRHCDEHHHDHRYGLTSSKRKVSWTMRKTERGRGDRIIKFYLSSF